MNESEQSLFDRISQFSFHDGNEELTFARRLARDNAWTQAYAARVIDEYKRFAFLAVVANHPVTPSDQVDQAWHLHLTYTKSYWDQFCGKVLGTPLHHGPTRGGPEESHKFDRWYQNTLKSYFRFFGHEPPADIWPDASIRFGQDLHFQRINTGRHWVIPKPRLTGAAGKIILFVLLMLVFFASALLIKPLLFGADHSWISTVSNRVESFGAEASHETNTPMLAQGISWPVIVLIVVAVACLVIFGLLFANRCPECNKTGALEKTGATEKGGLFTAGREEWKCKYCGHREWKNKQSGGGGGCGGGCGGG